MSYVVKYMYILYRMEGLNVIMSRETGKTTVAYKNLCG